MPKHRASAFGSFVCVTNRAAPSEKVEVEKSRDREPQPLVVSCAMQFALPFQERLRLRRVETKSLSLE